MATVDPSRRDTPELVAPVITPGHTYGSVTDKISAIVPQAARRSLGWFIGFAISFLLVMLLTVSLTMLLVYGVGLWGLDIPVAWAWGYH